ncbi:MAG: polymer-forming cytoskeletal protein [Chloroflexi bacterium]|nr:MAG: polymer-forming cytoskeletal protein [Chloroflexota bacterium]
MRPRASCWASRSRCVPELDRWARGRVKAKIVRDGRTRSMPSRSNSGSTSEREMDRSNNINVVTIGPRDSLSGTLTVDGDIRIEGTVEGEIHATGDINIEAAAELRATLNGNNVSVRGSVTGDVTATARLSLGGSGNVTGDVRASRLQVDDGATVNGAIKMGSGA